MDQTNAEVRATVKLAQGSGGSRLILTCPKGCGETVMGIVVLELYDGILFWACDKCAHRWHRFNDGPRRLIAEPYVLSVLVGSSAAPLVTTGASGVSPEATEGSE